jgi:hypothetical protein
MQDKWEFFVQTTHPGAIQVDGDTATGRAYLCEVGRRLAEIHHRYGRAPGESVNPAHHADDPQRSRAGSPQSRPDRIGPQTGKGANARL